MPCSREGQELMGLYKQDPDSGTEEGDCSLNSARFNCPVQFGPQCEKGVNILEQFRGGPPKWLGQELCV